MGLWGEIPSAKKSTSEVLSMLDSKNLKQLHIPSILAPYLVQCMGDLSQ
jgi:hypothetical protein